VFPLPDERDVLARLVAWAEATPDVRALVLTSSRARGDATVDLLSDYDVIVAVRDAAAFVAGDGWPAVYGEPVARWDDRHELYGETTYFCGVVHEDGVKVDYTVWPESLLDHVAAEAVLPDDLDVGYRVLVDKDDRTARWQAPTLRGHVPRPPTAEEYDLLVQEFWWITTYVAKSLWRGELAFTKFTLDYDAKLVALRRMLEWRIELDHDWKLRPGAYGRGLERLLPAELWAELAGTYAGLDADDNWDALFRTADLFRRVAREVGAALGYRYPQRVDDAVSAQLRAVRELPRPPR
jgi:aminoglycoside 6-adenylyltransferase